jgi:hypothetical protein
VIDVSAHFPASATQTVRARDGRTLCFADWDEEAGYPVLFLHGISGCRLSVRTVLPSSLHRSAGGSSPMTGLAAAGLSFVGG